MTENAFQIGQHGDIAVIVPSNVIEALSLDMIDEAAQLLLGPILRTKSASAVIDLSEVQYFGSVFISLLLRLWKQMTPRGGTLVICSASDKARELLRQTSLDTLWAIYDTREEAIDALNAE